MNKKSIEKRAEELGFQKMKFMKTKDHISVIIQIAQNLTPLNQDSKFTIEFMYDIFYYYRQEQSHSFAKNVAKLSMRKAI